ncbi:unnamed protein product [Cuscuta campestris]|uniref:Integrase catalytic domain-containing protein n=1 Tax=Cuscuta campestris TaxID=132261 RepID=A0A484NEE5_9ASTE|nr:unnamed protein product [Cuscuta campestris]
MGNTHGYLPVGLTDWKVLIIDKHNFFKSRSKCYNDKHEDLKCHSLKYSRRRTEPPPRDEPQHNRVPQGEEEAESHHRHTVRTHIEQPRDRVGRVESRLEKLQQRVDRDEKKKILLNESPFTDRVHETPFPKKAKLEVPKFTGKEDPEIHVKTLYQSGRMMGLSGDEKCLLFFQTLHGRAAEWFHNLPAGEIDSFDELAEVFQEKFKENCTKRKKFTYLSMDGQREHEDLTKFLTRWKDEVDKVEEMDDKTAMSLLVSGLCSEELYKDFCRSPPHVKGVIKQMIEARELDPEYLAEAKPKKNHWVRPEGQPAEQNKKKKVTAGKEHFQIIYGGPEGGDSASQRKKWGRELYVGTVALDPRRKQTRRESITFTDRDLPATGEDHNDPLVITMDMGGVDVSRVLVDTGSSVNILYLEAFEKLKLCRTRLEPLKTPVSGFTGDSVEAKGSILLTCELGTGDKFYTPGGIGHVRGDQKKARSCYLEAVKKMTKAFERVTLVSQEEDRSKLEPVDETEQIVLREAFPERMAMIDGSHRYIFAWSVADMPGIDRSVICHRLAIIDGSQLVTNNETEYEALAGGLRLARALEIKRMRIRSDSSLVLGQVNGQMEIREERLARYSDLVRALLRELEEFHLTRIPRTCQVFYKHPGRLATYYQPTSNVIPFARFGIDIIGAFLVAPGGKKFVMVAIDYFTKWIKAEAMATINVRQCEKFIWKNIVTQFGAPKMIVTDNDPQFRNTRFTAYLASFGIKHNKASVAYPQGNGQVENANRTIVDGIKKRLGEEGHKWLEALPHTIGAHRVTSRRATRETPFVLTYGCGARFPIKAEFPTFRETIYQPDQNEADHLAELNLVEE